MTAILYVIAVAGAFALIASLILYAPDERAAEEVEEQPRSRRR